MVFELQSQLLEWRAELATGAERVGWKVGGQAGLVGHLTSATRLRNGASYHPPTDELEAHAELAIEIGMAGEPIGFGAALELVDLERPLDVASNLGHRAFAMGRLRREPPPDVLTAELRVDGETASGEMRMDAAETTGRVADLLAAAGERVEPRDRIIAGAIAKARVARGAEVVADLGELGRVSLRLR